MALAPFSAHSVTRRSSCCSTHSCQVTILKSGRRPLPTAGWQVLRKSQLCREPGRVVTAPELRVQRVSASSLLVTSAVCCVLCAVCERQAGAAGPGSWVPLRASCHIVLPMLCALITAEAWLDGWPGALKQLCP